MTITRVHVPLGEAIVTEPDPFDTTSEPGEMEVASFAVEAVYRVELNTDGTAITARDLDYLRLVIQRIDADGDQAKTVFDALSVGEVTKLRDLLAGITIPEAVTA